jgi:hypothetical protein
MLVPAKMVSDTLDLARADGAIIRRKPNEIFDNSFVENLEKKRFSKGALGRHGARWGKTTVSLEHRANITSARRNFTLPTLQDRVKASHVMNSVSNLDRRCL